MTEAALQSLGAFGDVVAEGAAVLDYFLATNAVEKLSTIKHSWCLDVRVLGRQRSYDILQRAQLRLVQSP